MKLTPITNPVALRLDTTVGTRVFAGDTMIQGRTGWRSIDYLLQNGWVSEVSGLPVKISRTNNLVELRGYISRRNSPTSDILLELPPGFSPGAGHLFRAQGVANGTLESSPVFAVRVADRIVSLPNYASWMQHEMFIHALWSTEDPWPTVQP